MNEMEMAMVLAQLVIAMTLTALYGWTVERIAYRPLRHSFRLAPLISAIGMSIVMQNYVQIAQGARVKPLPPLIRGGYTLLENHGFAVEDKNLPSDLIVTHRSLFDNTIQGIKHKTLPIIAMQGHPEASPGPHDISYLFNNFIELINAKKR